MPPCFGSRRNQVGLSTLRAQRLPASMTAVAGPSGAGKTTLMGLLSGQLTAAAGSVSYKASI